MNQGILALSTDNAFAGANVFLSEELEQSQYLYEFFKGRGPPTAIELNRSNTGGPRMILYYPQEKQAYVAALVKRIDFHEWIVRGPYAMQRKDFRELEGITATVKGAPLFQIDRRPFRFKEANKIADLPPPAVVLKPKAKAKIVKKVEPAAPAHAPLLPALAPTPAASAVAAPTKAALEDFQKLNSDQKALRIAKGFAERADNGDIVHTVKRPEETLGDIARWYTDLEANAEVIAKGNGLAGASTVLPTGTRITVPSALIKQDKAMPTTFASGKVNRGEAQSDAKAVVSSGHPTPKAEAEKASDAHVNSSHTGATDTPAATKNNSASSTTHSSSESKSDGHTKSATHDAKHSEHAAEPVHKTPKSESHSAAADSGHAHGH